MPAISYVNGRYLPHVDASVHVEDRGYQFADGVYEVCEVLDGRLWDADLHFERLAHSLSELNITGAPGAAALRIIAGELIRRNHATRSLLYVQITRGVAPRSHAMPAKAPKPSLVMTLMAWKRLTPAQYEAGVTCITMPDLRWGRCDIKSIALLPNILAKQQAKEAGAYEALLTAEDGVVREGSSSNLFVVDAAGMLRTHPANRHILPGVTRIHALRLAQQLQIRLEERPVTMQELQEAKEVMVTSTSTHILPVTSIDGRPVGDGRPGPVAKRLLEAFREMQHGA